MDENNFVFNEMLPENICSIILNYKKQIELIKICDSPKIYISEDHILNDTANVKITAKLTNKMILHWYNLQSESYYNERNIYKHLRNLYSWWIYTKFKNNTNEETCLALDAMHACVNHYPQIIWSFGNCHAIKLSLRPILIFNDDDLTTQNLIINKFQTFILKIKHDFNANEDKSTVGSLIQHFFLNETYTYKFLLQR